MSIGTLTQDQAQEIVREVSSRALSHGNLSAVLSNNGKTGRSASGNYSLLAKATGLSRVHIGKVLRGRVEPSHRTLIKLSSVTGISIDDISEFILEMREKVA